MTALLGGIGALIVGFILLVVWWSAFIEILKGAIPVIFILGGALAIYIGIDEIKDKAQQPKET
jgi:uncharacterized membrane protein